MGTSVSPGPQLHLRAPSDLAYLVLLASIWGSSFLWIKISLRGFSPAQNTVLRLFLGALALVVYAWARGIRLPRGWAIWGHLSAVAGVASVLPYLLFAVAEQRVDSAVAGVLNATTPLFTAVVAASAGLERVNGRKLAGLVLGFIGVLLVFAPWQSGSQMMSWSGLACLGAAACYALGYVYTARFISNRGLSPLPLAAGQMISASVLSLVLIPLLGWPAPVWRTDAVIATVVLGALGTGIAIVINYRLIANTGASGAALVTYLIPVVAVTVGAVTLGERITPNILIGAAIVLLGVGITRSGSQGASTFKEHPFNPD